MPAATASSACPLRRLQNVDFDANFYDLCIRDMKIFASLLAFAALWLIAACHPTDERLLRIDSMLNAEGDSAACADPSPLAAIDSINPSELTEANRQLYNLLAIKARDKAYIRHTSDSVIAPMLAWFSTHSTGRYAEALYYAGRVYSDLGDHSTALRCYDDALDALPSGGSDGLRLRINSQTGRLLNELRLYSQALPYLQESMRLADSADDPMIAYDYLLLGEVYKNLKEYDKAEANFTKAIEAAKDLTDEDIATMQGCIAALKYEQKKYDEALALIESVLHRVGEVGNTREYFVSYKTDIFFKLNELDSAYRYSLMNKISTNKSYRIAAYRRLLSQELRQYSPIDSILVYNERYLQALEANYNEHDAQAAIVQNSMYNYSLHERRSQKLLSEKRVLATWLSSAVTLVMLLIVMVLIMRQHNARKIASLQKSLAALEALLQNRRLPPVAESSSITTLRASIQAKLTEAAKAPMPRLPEDLLNSPGYLFIQKHLASATPIPAYSPDWVAIAESITLSYPSFFENLSKLSSGKMKEEDKHLAMLIKMQFTPMQTTILMARSKSTNSYHRRAILNAILPHFNNVTLLDKIIYLL